MRWWGPNPLSPFPTGKGERVRESCHLEGRSDEGSNVLTLTSKARMLDPSLRSG